MNPITRTVVYDKSDWGIREVPLTKKALPVGYVGYCNPCNWSTSICVGMRNDLAGWDRADTKLRNHLKSREHIHRLKK